MVVERYNVFMYFVISKKSVYLFKNSELKFIMWLQVRKRYNRSGTVRAATVICTTQNLTNRPLIYTFQAHFMAAASEFILPAQSISPTFSKLKGGIKFTFSCENQP